MKTRPSPVALALASRFAPKAPEIIGASIEDLSPVPATPDKAAAAATKPPGKPAEETP